MEAFQSLGARLMPSRLARSIDPVDTLPELAVPPMPAEAGTGGSALSRLLDIFDLFNPQSTLIQIDGVAEHLGVGRSTAYRYLQELGERGFLVQRGKGRYALGPRVIELERLLQHSDPLLNAGKTVMADLADLCQNRTLLLCTLFKDRVLCTHQVGANDILYNKEKMPIYRGRGSVLPLFQGAGSQAILAWLAPHQIRALYLAKAAEIRDAGLGEDWKAFRSALAGIRKQGYAMTVGRRNARVQALAVPVLSVSGQVVASLLLLSANTEKERETVLGVVPRLQDASVRIGELEDQPVTQHGG
jgi:DNA-binding IclR family transcriptional regulator